MEYTADNYRADAKEYRKNAMYVLASIFRKEKLLASPDISQEDKDALQEGIRLLKDVYDELIELESLMIKMSNKVDGNYKEPLYEM